MMVVDCWSCVVIVVLFRFVVMCMIVIVVGC